MLPSLHLCPIGTGADDRSRTAPKLEGDKSDSQLLDLLEADLKGLIAESVVDDRPCTRLEALRKTNNAAVLGKDEVLSAVKKNMRDNLWLDRALETRGGTLSDLSALCSDLKKINKFFEAIPKWVGNRGPMRGPDVEDFKKMLKEQETGVQSIDEVMDYVILVHPRVVLVGPSDIWVPMKERFNAFEKEDWVIRVVRQAPHALMNLDIEADGKGFRKNRNVILAAVEIDGSALEWADDELKKDEGVVIAALRSNYGAWKHVDPSVKEVPAVRTEAEIARIRERDEVQRILQRVMQRGRSERAARALRAERA